MNHQFPPQQNNMYAPSAPPMYNTVATTKPKTELDNLRKIREQHEQQALQQKNQSMMQHQQNLLQLQQQQQQPQQQSAYPSIYPTLPVQPPQAKPAAPSRMTFGYYYAQGKPQEHLQ